MPLHRDLADMPKPERRCACPNPMLPDGCAYEDINRGAFDPEEFVFIPGCRKPALEAKAEMEAAPWYRAWFEQAEWDDVELSWEDLGDRIDLGMFDDPMNPEEGPMPAKTNVLDNQQLVELCDRRGYLGHAVLATFQKTEHEEVAVYENADLSHHGQGDLRFFPVVDGSVFEEVGGIPDQLPDMRGEINWRYHLRGVWRRA